MSESSNNDAFEDAQKEEMVYAQWEKALKDRTKAFYTLRLYITGNTARSSRAIQNIQRICQTHLAGRYELEVIDIFQQPHLAVQAQIIAAPTLVRQRPLPLRKMVGDMTDEKRLLIGLDIFEKDE